MTDTRIVTAANVRPLFQVATGDADAAVGTAVYDTARYDQTDAIYGGLDADWSDEGCDVVDAVTWLGRQRSADVFDVGRAVINVRNDDGRWDYPPPDPPPTPLTLRPGRQCRVGVTVDDGPPVWLFHGWIDVWTPTYLPNHLLDTVTIDAVCAKGEFGRVSAPAVTAPVGDAETVTARMTRYADVAEFPAHRRQFAPSGVTLAGTSLGGRVGELADVSATSAGGDVFGDQNGYLRFEGADWRVRASAPLDGYIGNRGNAGEVCPDSWEISFARSDFTTRVNYGRSGADAETVEDATNKARYGIETWDLTELETIDEALVDRLGARALTLRDFDLAPRVAAVTVNAARPGAAQLLAGADPFWPSMYGCCLVQAGRTVFDRPLYVTGIEHTITGGQWSARLALDDATPWLSHLAPAVYDTAVYDTDVYARVPT